MYTTLNQGFLINGAVIGSNGSSYDISSMIKDIMIKKDYLTQNFPLFVIDLKTTEEIRDFIRDNNSTINLSIYIYNMDENNDTTEEDTSNPTITDTYFTGNIRIYDKPFSTTSSKKEEDGDADDTKTQSESAPFVYYRVSGIPEELIEKNKNIINEAYADVTLDDVLVNVITSIEDDEVYIQPSDNKEVKRSVFIPPSTLTQAIDFLDGNYQIYNGVCRTFLDTNCTYVYNPYTTNLETYNVFEYKVLNVNSTGNSQDYLKPSIDKTNNNIKFTTKSVPGFASQERIIGNSIGSNVNYYSYDDNFNLIVRGENGNISYEKTKYFWNPNRLKIFETAELNTLEKSSKAIIITLRDMNPGYIRPNTSFVVSSVEYPEVSGEYFLSNISMSFSSGDLKHYSVLMSLNLIKRS